MFNIIVVVVVLTLFGGWQDIWNFVARRIGQPTIKATCPACGRELNRSRCICAAS